MNILYIGSSGSLSLVPFKRLLKSQYNIVAVGVFKPPIFETEIIALEPISLERESLALCACQQSIPLIDLSKPIDEIARQCKCLNIDVVLMSCYSKRLPQEIIHLASKGCFNMHPSLLPKYRGAEPIFWQMKAGDDIGVSWHFVDSDFDTGDIVVQQKLLLDDGMSHAEISLLAAQKGADLMINLLQNLSTNSFVGTKQNNTDATYHSYPDTKDFVIDLNWTARHAYNFMKSTEAFNQYYRCETGLYCFELDHALDYDNNCSLNEVEVKGQILYIPCKEGVLIASFTGKL